MRSYLSDATKQSIIGLAANQEERGRETTPLRDRALLDKLIADNRGQLNRLTDTILALKREGEG
jgi:hypothetical protein